MAMDKDVLGQAIRDRILTMVPFGIIVPNDIKASMAEFWTAIADEIIKHIQENAEVKITVTTTGPVIDVATNAPVTPALRCDATGEGVGIIDPPQGE